MSIFDEDDDDLHERGETMSTAADGTVVERATVQPIQPIEARPFTSTELSGLAERVPCLFYVDGGPYGAGAGMMPRGISAMLAGAPGSGKSWLALELLLAAANGGPLFGVKDVPGLPYVREQDAGRVLFISLEDTREMVGQRLRDICAARGLLEEWQRDAYLSRLHIMSWNDADVRACKKRALVRYSAADSSVSRLELFDRVSARLAVPGEPWSLIVVDTLARSARGEVEASAEAATDVIQEFEEWTQIAGNPTVVVLHHTRKSDANLDNPGKWLQSALTQDAVRGSSALAGAVRWLGVLAKLRIDVDSDKRTPSLPLRNAFFEVAKTNGAAEDAMSRLHLVPEERGVLRLAHELERAAWNECMQQPSKREKSSEPHGSAPPSRRTNGSSSQPRPFHDPRDTD